MMFKKKGFTLIELLAALAIMGIVVTMSFYSYISYKKKSEEKLLKIEAEQIKIAANAYLREIEADSNYKSYFKEDPKTGVVTEKSCISIRKLQEMGYYKGDLNFENKDYDKAVVKVTKIDGVGSYEVLTNYNALDDEKGSQHCYSDVYTSTGITGGFELKPTEEKDKDKVNLTTEINGTNESGVYDLKMSLTAKVLETITTEVTETNSDQYVDVMMILDNSGSMGSTCDFNKAIPSTDYEQAADAAKSLSIKIRGEFEENSRIGLIQFNMDAELSRKFEKSQLYNSNFKCSPYTTDTLHALDLGLIQFTKDVPTDDLGKVVTDVKKYAVLLTDGQPNVDYNGNCDSFDDACKRALINMGKKYTNSKVNLIVIGYGINDNTFKEMASKNVDGICNNSDYKDSFGVEHCYYESTSSANFSSIFDSITESIINSVTSKTVTNAKIVATFSDDLIMKDLNGKMVKEIMIDIPVVDDKIDADQKLRESFEYRLSTKNVSFDENDSGVSCDYTKKECTKTVNIFNSYKLQLFNDKTMIKELVLGLKPKVTLTKKLESYINY